METCQEWALQEATFENSGDSQSEEEEGLEADEQGADEQDDQPAGTGTYATLQGEGPQTSAGSTKHPDQCMPCTFYCFTRRGCNRGADCRFCHLTHQSKLQQRREAWKKQQREKRKSIRERVAQEAMARRGNAKPSNVAKDSGSSRPAAPQGGGPGSSPIVHQDQYTWTAQRARETSGAGNADKADMRASRLPEVLEGGFSGAQFTYNVNQAILTIGQYVELWPQLPEMPGHFRLGAPLPQGMILDSSNGVIHGSPSQSTPRSTVVVEAVLINGLTMRSTVDVEVVDFTRGGFVIGHMSELEPGKFMLLLYVPDGSEDVEDAGALKFLQLAGDPAAGNNQGNATCAGQGTFPHPGQGGPGKSTFRHWGDRQDGQRKIDGSHGAFGGKEMMQQMELESMGSGGMPQRHNVR